MSDFALQVNDVKKKIDDFELSLNFKVLPGELVSIIGPSGCGKTSTIGLISGLLSPDSGNIIINSRDVTEEDVNKRSTAVVFQDYALFPHLNVEKNIAFPMKLKKTHKAEISARVSELLDMVKLNGFNRRSVNELSGGEKQRVALSRAIAAEPTLLLLDEPLSALDTKLRITLRSEIRSLQRQLGLTTIYITHDQSEALSISDRIIVLHDGKIEQFDTPEEVYRHPETLFCARFMGEGNILPYNIIPRVLVSSKVDSQSFVYENLGEDHKIFFRPEMCEIMEPEMISINLLNSLRFQNCKIESTEYEGERWKIICNYQGFLITTYSGRKMKTDSVDLGVRLDRILEFNQGRRIKLVQ